jgi:hypothetical protein
MILKKLMLNINLKEKETLPNNKKSLYDFELNHEK